MGDNDEARKLGPPWVLFFDGGAPGYIMPAGRPGDVADVSGMSTEDAERIVRLANKSSDVRKLGTALSGIAVASLIAQRDDEKMRAVEEWKQANGYDDLIAAYSDSVDRANKLEAERDAARARVRSIAAWPLGNAALSERILSAREIVAEWDKETQEQALLDWSKRGAEDISGWDEEEKKR